MFDSLDEQMKKDTDRESSPKERLMKWVVVIVAAMCVFGGLVIVVRMVGS